MEVYQVVRRRLRPAECFRSSSMVWNVSVRVVRRCIVLIVRVSSDCQVYRTNVHISRTCPSYARYGTRRLSSVDSDYHVYRTIDCICRKHVFSAITQCRVRVDEQMTLCDPLRDDVGRHQFRTIVKECTRIVLFLQLLCYRQQRTITYLLGGL